MRVHEETIRLMKVEMECAEQYLGRALRYAPYPDDWPHGDAFPYDKDAVCIGEHTTTTIAMEAAARLTAGDQIIQTLHAILLMTDGYAGSDVSNMVNHFLHPWGNRS